MPANARLRSLAATVCGGQSAQPRAPITATPAAASSPISDADAAHFHSFGFLCVKALFTPSEASAMHEECGRLFADDRLPWPPGSVPEEMAGATDRTISKSRFVESSRLLTRLLIEDPRILEAVPRLLGTGPDDTVYLGSNGVRWGAVSRPCPHPNHQACCCSS